MTTERHPDHPGVMVETPPSDQELVARARAGEANGFAALVYRYAPVLHADAVAKQAIDPTADVVAVLTRAMRRLDDAPAEDLAPWMAGQVRSRRRSAPVLVPPPEEVPSLPEQVLDAIWAELAARWPSGRRAVRLPRWLGQLAVVAVLLALSVAVPYLLLVTAAGTDDAGPPLAQLVAEPLDEEGWPGPDDGDPSG